MILSISGIHLWVLGQSDVSWSDKPGGKRGHFEYEIYMKDCLILWGKGKCNHCHRLISVYVNVYIEANKAGKIISHVYFF